MEIDVMCWADASMSHLCFEALPAGSGVAGGVGGGGVTQGVWLHDAIEELGIRDEIEAVLSGACDRLSEVTRRQKWR
jgi:hypothetical protein